jgi:RimJ/RimL family protein N-acetyltransferase
MIHSVTGEGLHLLLPLFKDDCPNRAALLAFLEGRGPGIAYADNAEHPTAALVSTNLYSFSYVGGTPDTAWLAEAITELRKQRYLVITHAAWMPDLALPEPDRILPRLEYLHPQKEWQVPPVSLPERYYFRPLDADLLERCLWGEEMVAAYGNVEDFLANAVGFCLMHGDEICCEAYALLPGDGHYEIGTVTHEAYRGKGYAYATCLHLAEACAERGYETSWSCDVGNEASQATARKLGYATVREYQFYYYSHLA